MSRHQRKLVRKLRQIVCFTLFSIPPILSLSFSLSHSLTRISSHTLSFSLLQSHPRTHTLSHWCFLINYSLAEASQPCCWIPSSYNECLYYLLNRSINIDRVRLGHSWAVNRNPSKPFLRRCSTTTVMKCSLRRQQGTSPCLYKFLLTVLI